MYEAALGVPVFALLPIRYVYFRVESRLFLRQVRPRSLDSRIPVTLPLPSPEK